jgi:hypothetical protein
VLAYFNPKLNIYLETNASNYIAAAILSQIGSNSVLRPIVFLLKKISLAKCNYKIYNKKLLAIVLVFRE